MHALHSEPVSHAKTGNKISAHQYTLRILDDNNLKIVDTNNVPHVVPFWVIKAAEVGLGDSADSFHPPVKRLLLDPVHL